MKDKVRVKELKTPEHLVHILLDIGGRKNRNRHLIFNNHLEISLHIVKHEADVARFCAHTNSHQFKADEAHVILINDGMANWKRKHREAR